MLELLAPAGNAECAAAAIDNGANAIYLGYSAFSARQGAENFNDESLRETVKRAHCCNVNVYVAMNTVVKNSEMAGFLETLLSVWSMGVDAIILQDVLLGKAVHQKYPEIVLHLSTQAGVCTENGAKFAKACGFSRVILARETPLAEIAKIAKILETEVFVQGALCTCFSGACYFSSFAGGNSGNRGRCKQPCRKTYTLNRTGFEERAYALSLSDLSVGEDIAKYIAAGAVSFKIEGRMRRAEYVAAAVRYYRILLDGQAGVKEKEQALSDLKRTYNRGNYTKGLAFGQDKRFLSRLVQGHIGEKVGAIKVVNGKYLVESNFKPVQGDAFKILREGKEVGGAVFSKTEGKGFIVSSKVRLKNGDGVFITTDTTLNTRLFNQTKARGKIRLSLYFCENERAVVSGEGITYTSEQELQSANSRPLTKEELVSCFSKTDGLPLDVVFDSIHLQGNIFIPKSALNGIRRAYFALLIQKLTGERIAYESTALEEYTFTDKNNKTAVIADSFKDVIADIAIYKPKDYNAPFPEEFLGGTFEKYVYYPSFCTAADEQILSQRLKEYALDGVYVENYGGLQFAKETGVKAFAGTGLNLTNGVAIAQLLKDRTLSYYAVSKELSEKEAETLSGERAFALSGGGIKLMDLCYCPFGKTCMQCDKKETYTLTDENGRQFPLRRYQSSDSACRFEVYNCATLIGEGLRGAGRLLDLTLTEDKNTFLKAGTDVQQRKDLSTAYTSGHFKRGVL